MLQENYSEMNHRTGVVAVVVISLSKLIIKDFSLGFFVVVC